MTGKGRDTLLCSEWNPPLYQGEEMGAAQGRKACTGPLCRTLWDSPHAPLQRDLSMPRLGARLAQMLRRYVLPRL